MTTASVSVCSEDHTACSRDAVRGITPQGDVCVSSGPGRCRFRQMNAVAWISYQGMHCGRMRAMALAPLIIRWGGETSSDTLRHNARRRRCGCKGAKLQCPSWAGEAWAHTLPSRPNEPVARRGVELAIHRPRCWPATARSGMA